MTEPQILTVDEWRRLFDRAVRRELGISGDEFIAKWHAGKYGNPDDDPRIMRLLMIRPSDDATTPTEG